jgi:hypothetical protein
MDRFLNRAVNFAILIAALCLLTLVFDTMRQRHQATLANQPLLHVGDVVHFSSIPVSQQTLVIALQTGCHFCEDSLPFYRRLSKETTGSSTHLTFGFPHLASDGAALLRTNGIEGADVREMDFSRMGIRGTPTLILVDGHGKVQKFWAGKLAPAKEAEVEAALR